MSSLPPSRTIYLDGAPEPVCAIFHPPAPQAVRATAVIFCPPFGWDEVCSYRSRRAWAQRLAAAGFASIRLSLPGTGDSGGGPRDPARLEAWTAAIASAAEWVRAATGARRTVAVGMGLGGVLAYRAAATGAPIDDLVLWATPARARSLVRQLRAFSRLERSQFFEGIGEPPPLPPGELEAGGFLLSATTVDELECLDLTALPLADAPSRRVLLLERDGIAVDAGLREQLESWGAQVTVAPGQGYEAMTSHPQRSQPPLEVIDRVTAWLVQGGASAFPAPAQGPLDVVGASDIAWMKIGHDTRVKETPLTLEQPFGRLEGILSEPLGPREPGLCAVLLNAGAVRRIGPSRMWVEAARRWAARGVPTLRLDVEGIGDSDGDIAPYSADAALYVPELIPQVLASLDHLQERGVGERFVVLGLCAGAYWCFQLALQDPRVTGALMVNPRALIWDPGIAPGRDFRALMTELPSWSKIRKNASAERIRALALWMAAAPKRKSARLRAARAGSSAGTDGLDDALDRLGESGKTALMLFSEGEPLRDELLRSGALARIEGWENVTLEYIRVRDHTLRPNWAQRQAHQALDRAIDRELSLNRVSERAAQAS